MKQRSIGLVILLSIITCGIYGIYWTIVTIMALDEEGQSSNMPSILQIVLLFFYVGYIVFALNADSNINAIKARKGMQTTDNKILYIVLGIFLPIVLIAMVQNEINKIA